MAEHPLSDLFYRNNAPPYSFYQC